MREGEIKVNFQNLHEQWERMSFWVSKYNHILRRYNTALQKPSWFHPMCLFIWLFICILYNKDGKHKNKLTFKFAVWENEGTVTLLIKVLWSRMDVRVGLWRRLSAEEWCFWTVVLEKTLESPLDCKEIQPVRSEGDQPWDIFGRNDAKAEAPLLWPSHANCWLIGKDSDAGRHWGQEEKGTTEDEMDGWHHGLDGRESEWIPGDGDGQGGLACCDSWGCKESERLSDWTELISGSILLLTVLFSVLAVNTLSG